MVHRYVPVVGQEARGIQGPLGLLQGAALKFRATGFRRSRTPAAARCFNRPNTHCLTLASGKMPRLGFRLTLPGQEFVSLGLRAFITLLRSIACRTWTKAIRETRLSRSGSMNRPARGPGDIYWLNAQRDLLTASGRSDRRGRPKAGGGQAAKKARLPSFRKAKPSKPRSVPSRVTRAPGRGDGATPLD